ncbi:MAG: c-type cytochrome [Methyloprofundus sp.]|nr:c-type cytochrome [Methyloprofundus sp.]
MKIRKVMFFLLMSSCVTETVLAKDDLAIPVFKAYCWGCHHQTAQAFGPSFKEIANHRTKDEIIAQIVSPQSSYKILGYKRNSMPAFDDLNTTQLNLIANYILSFKDEK